MKVEPALPHSGAPDSTLFHSYICADCADELGGRWPEGRLTTLHEAECLYCRKVKVLCNVRNYNWPDGKARGMRD